MQILWLFIFLILPQFLNGEVGKTPPKPNIIFILADDLVSFQIKKTFIKILYIYFLRALMMSDFMALLRYPLPILMLWPIRELF